MEQQTKVPATSVIRDFHKFCWFNLENKLLLSYFSRLTNHASHIFVTSTIFVFSSLFAAECLRWLYVQHFIHPKIPIAPMTGALCDTTLDFEVKIWQVSKIVLLEDVLQKEQACFVSVKAERPHRVITWQSHAWAGFSSKICHKVQYWQQWGGADIWWWEQPY